MTRRLAGKVAVITGAASGIGKASVELFAREGAKVVAADIDDEHRRTLQSAHPGAVVYTHADVTSEADIAAMIETAARQFGKLDIVFNNAGGRGGQPDRTPRNADRVAARWPRARTIARRHGDVRSGTAIRRPAIAVRNHWLKVGLSTTSPVVQDYGTFFTGSVGAPCRLLAVEDLR